MMTDDWISLNTCVVLNSRDGPNVRLWHLAEAEGFDRITERSAELRPNVVWYDERHLLVTGERTEQPGNVVISISKHMSAHASFRMRNYVRKLQYIIKNILKQKLRFLAHHWVSELLVEYVIIFRGLAQQRRPQTKQNLAQR